MSKKCLGSKCYDININQIEIEMRFGNPNWMNNPDFCLCFIYLFFKWQFMSLESFGFCNRFPRWVSGYRKGGLHHQSQCLGILIGRRVRARCKSIGACKGGHGSSCTEPHRVECVSSGQNLWIKGGLNLKQERTEQSITHWLMIMACKPGG